MARYNTGNQVPSSDMRDIWDDNQIQDSIINGAELVVTDRKGNKRKSWAGVEKDSADKLEQIDRVITSLDTGSFTFPDIATGLAGTVNGQYFRVPQPKGATAAFIYYRNQAGLAVVVASVLSSVAFDALNQDIGGMGEVFRTPNGWFDDNFNYLAAAPATGNAYTDKINGYYNKSANASGQIKTIGNRPAFYLTSTDSSLAYVQYTNTLTALELKAGQALFSLRLLTLSDAGRQNDRAVVIQLDAAGQEIQRDAVRFPITAITENTVFQVPFTILAACQSLVCYISVSDSSHSVTFDNVMLCRGRYPLYRPPYKRVILDYSSDYVKQTEANTVSRQGWLLERVFPNICADETFRSISDMWTGTVLPVRQLVDDVPFLKFSDATAYWSRSVLRSEIQSDFISFGTTINSKTAGSQQFRLLLIQYRTENGNTSVDEISRSTYQLSSGTVISSPALVEFAGVAISSQAKSFRLYVAGSGTVLMNRMFIGGGVSSAFRHALFTGAVSAAQQSVYLSPAGDDGNNGVYSAPVRSFARAAGILGRAGRIVYLGGDYGDEGVIRLTGDQNYTIEAEPMKRVRIIRGTQLSGGWALMSGKTKTWARSYTGTAPYRFIFQENTPEGLISADQRHPLHCGKTYRLPSTRLWPAAMLAELETATRPCWFLDATAGMLYISAPASGDPNKELYRISGGAVVSGSGTGNVVRVNGIEAWYAHMDYTGFAWYELSNSYTLGGSAEGGIMSGGAYGIQRNNEIAAACNDGGNAHNTLVAGTDMRSHTVVTNEWAHDCYDDGRSPHERCCETVSQSLYEYNGANGYVAALGAKAVVFSSWSRKNGVLQPSVAGNGKSFGFGTVLAPLATEGTKFTELICHNCISEDQNGGFMAYGPDCLVTTFDCRTSNTLLALGAMNNGGSESTQSQLISHNTMDSGSVTKKLASNGGVVKIANYELIS